MRPDDNQEMPEDPLINSLRAAVDSAPDDLTLRMHLAETLARAGRREEAITEAAVVLLRDPENEAAIRLIGGGAAASFVGESGDIDREGSIDPPDGPSSPEGGDDELDETLRMLDEQLSDIVPPRFVEQDASTIAEAPSETERPGITLADVGGMQEVKDRLEASFLAPLRNPELVKLYGKSLRGGLLLYGPPGCGKTFIARALAGEMGAEFMAVSLADVLDMYLGESERNVHELFETARRNAPCVMFLDEVDALGQKRSQTRSSGMRGTVNQLLSEMDGVSADNRGVYVLGATNHPWDVDVALRRPGRFDRMLLVTPPDTDARDAILRLHLRDRPIAGVDTRKLAEITDGFSGADLAYVTEAAAEKALLAAARSGKTELIGMAQLEAAVAEVKPSIGPWLETARNVAQFANEGGSYDELLAYLRQRKLV